MTRLVQSSPQIDAYLADCDRLVSGRPATEPSWLRNLRRKGIEHFADAGFPTTRDEEWKFTSVASIADRHFALPAHDGHSGLTTDQVERWAGALGGYRLVLVNGVYAPQWSVGRAACRRARVQSAVHPGHEPGGRGAISRPVRPP
jgi:Fe-S cluster assembly protein SufD